MVRTKAGDSAAPTQVPADADSTEAATANDTANDTADLNGDAAIADANNVDEIFGALKTLLTTVEKLQKARQEVGDIKPLVLRVLDGELVSDEELEQLKAGIGGLSRLVKLYTDYNTALAKAQPARSLLDQILKP